MYLYIRSTHFLYKTKRRPGRGWQTYIIFILQVYDPKAPSNGVVQELVRTQETFSCTVATYCNPYCSRMALRVPATGLDLKAVRRYRYDTRKSATVLFCHHPASEMLGMLIKTRKLHPIATNTDYNCYMYYRHRLQAKMKGWTTEIFHADCLQLRVEGPWSQK